MKYQGYWDGLVGVHDLSNIVPRERYVEASVGRVPVACAQAEGGRRVAAVFDVDDFVGCLVGFKHSPVDGSYVLG